MSNNYVYFTGLELENVRAFGEHQTLSLTNGTQAPAQWTLIIGENGVGKTTLLQCLANMRPVPNVRAVRKDQNTSRQYGIYPAINEDDNPETFNNLSRATKNAHLSLKAKFSFGVPLNGSKNTKPKSIFTSLSVGRIGGKVDTITPGGTNGEIDGFEEPLVIGYGASRHMGYANASQVSSSGAVASLFDSSLELFDAEEILQQLDYSQFKKMHGARELLIRLRAALATILPDISRPEDIEIYGPKGLSLRGKKGVHVRTPYGLVPFSSLSLGYQTVSAWTIDMAWRLFEKYPNSSNPLSEPAIVLVDEIDLHLHPRWQRQIRRELSKHFPNVQFIATAHSPLIAQTYLNDNLAVVRREGRQAVIVNDPVTIKGWRLDQVITSELFGLDSSRSPEIEDQMERRVSLLQKRRKSPTETRELLLLDRALDDLPSEELRSDDKALDIIRRAAQILKA